MFSSLYPLARASLFKMDAEDAHHLTLRALGAAGRTGLACALSARVPDAPRTVMGLTFRNPVGLAAGLDKDGAAIDGLASLGLTVHRPDGTYFATTDVAALGWTDGLSFCLALAERAGVVAIPSQVFYDDQDEGRHLVRWAFCKRPEVIEEGLRRLAGADLSA